MEAIKPLAIDWARPWGLLSDAHGNPDGLRLSLTLLQERGAATLFFLGDAVGYLPRADEVVDILRAEGAICLKGNHDAMLLGELPIDEKKDKAYRLKTVRERLSPRDREFLRACPDRLDMVHPRSGKKYLLVHGGLPDPLGTYVYLDSVATPFVQAGVDVVFCGHTHRPFIRRDERLLLVNVGSCGLPRDIGNSPSSALYHPATGHVEILRTTFDAEAVIAASETLDPLPAAVRECLKRNLADGPK